MKNKTHYADVAARFMRMWRMPGPSGETPLTFTDGLARVFFHSSLARLLYAAYRCGVRDEQKRQKQRSTRRWLRRQNRR
jgi:hypothetical protein